ncbi:MAG: R-phenyllactate dehydratase beta subunit [Syntrophus sp. PtaB.Bin138]|jgi:benzoyl-CoA reductase/2-hydroxyglutaryl-CoA dehydratase subunit BcrC/BadD/HgdB|uniref:double-cubane-cluster-containing anaerobic reductase n=1 Tax=Syntrophus sp. (in: bacteria) TaxID=48412 RepID=UPI0009CD4BCB|nr:MAG: R-phenyllactate dehydratase beta subunit [Syntrophus sp. PtaB.Bin138]
MQAAMAAVPPLIENAQIADPVRRFLEYVLNKREQGNPVVGVYCGYAPVELIRAMGAVPVSLCSASQWTIPAAEAILPANLCPMIKSSFGFIRTNACFFYAASDAVIGETTCDGKKKMFELIAHLKPTFIMDLPQLPDDTEVLDRWRKSVLKLQGFLEKTLQTSLSADRLEAEIRETNRKNRLMDRFFAYLACRPIPVSWREIYDVITLEHVANGDEFQDLIEKISSSIDQRIALGQCFGTFSSPRILVSGCPVGGDACKVLQIIEEAGGVVVAMEACSGMKNYFVRITEESGDPLRAVAESTLSIPCSCMTPNRRRLDLLDKMIARFSPDAVIDVVLHACHAYNVESHKIRKHVQKKHGLPCLKIETDYSKGDIEQIRTRVEALFENLELKK